MDCIHCPSTQVHKNGKLHSGGQRRKCKECKKQFSTGGSGKVYSTEFKKKVVDEYCHSPAGAKAVLEKYGISSRTLIKWKKKHLNACPLCVS